ncbi:hypothetical protein CP8484711_1484A, partial [Chlamydia psittaci 84-8471/1]
MFNNQCCELAFFFIDR